MPLIKRKPMLFRDEVTPEALVNENSLVFQIRTTGEIFSNYKDYVNRVNQYRDHIYTCSKTGKVNMTLEEALICERKAMANIESFPDCYHETVLRLTQHSAVELKTIVDNVANYLKDTFLVGEMVDAFIDNATYQVEILSIEDDPATESGAKKRARLEPPSHTNGTSNNPMDLDVSPSSSSPQSSTFPDQNNHNTSNGTTSTATAPASSSSTANKIYLVRIVGGGPRKRDGTKPWPKVLERYIRGNLINRRRGTFSKETIKQFIRDNAYRPSYIGSPWLVKDALVQKYNLPTEIPAHIKRLHDKHANKLHEVEAKEDRKRQREEEEKSQEVTYPIEDLDLPNATTPEKSLPKLCYDFVMPQDILSDFFVTWTFFQAFGVPLHLYPFSMDDFETALNHQGDDCHLIIEVHVAMLRILITRGDDDNDSVKTYGPTWSARAITPNTWYTVLQQGFDHGFRTAFPNFEEIFAGSYQDISCETKISILLYMVNTALSRNVIRKFIDESEDKLQELRKEKRLLQIELRRMIDDHEEQEKNKAKQEHSHEKPAEESPKPVVESDDESVEDNDTEDNDKLSRTAKLRSKQKKREAEEKSRRGQLERQRDEARRRSMEIRAQQEERKQYELEVNKRQKQIDYLLDEIAKHRVLRMSPLGSDRFRSQYFFFDGIGSGYNMVGSGRLFVRSEDGTWGYLHFPEEVDEVIQFLDVRGVRELDLHESLTEYAPRIRSFMARRIKGLTSVSKLEDARRSTRINHVSKHHRFMQYQNKWADWL